MFRSAIAQMLPPRPPSPPSGPPRGTYFSRRNDTAPLPPSPAITSMFASSMNFIVTSLASGGERAGSARCRRRVGSVARRLHQERVATVGSLRVVAHRNHVQKVFKQSPLRLAEIMAGHTGAGRQVARQRFRDRAIGAPWIEGKQPKCDLNAHTPGRL